MGRKREQMSIKELSIKLAALTVLADEVKKAKDELRAEMMAEMASVGADRVKATIGEQSIAYITTVNSKTKPKVIRENGFINWVKENMPHEIVESVRESSRERILETIMANGELHDWLDYVEADPYVSTRFHADGREAIKTAFRNGELELKRLVKEIEG
jgi:hypothetical protein